MQHTNQYYILPKATQTVTSHITVPLLKAVFLPSLATTAELHPLRCAATSKRNWACSEFAPRHMAANNGQLAQYVANIQHILGVIQ